MTRTSRLASSVLALSLAILPAAAFAQQTTAPVQATAPDGQATKTPAAAPETQAAKTPAATETQAAKAPAGGTVHANTAQPAESKASAHGVKAGIHAKEAAGGKEATTPHAKPGTTTHTTPAKTAVPDKS